MELSTKEQMGRALEKLMLTNRFRKITIQMICSEAHVTRQTFYNYFNDKEDALRWIVENDYQKNVVPMVTNKIGSATVVMHFRYVREKGGFYSNLYQIDGGMLLHKLLMQAFDTIRPALHEIADTRIKNVGSVRLDLYLRYYHSGIASIVVHWIKGGFEISEAEIAQTQTILLNNSMRDVRIHYLDLG